MPNSIIYCAMVSFPLAPLLGAVSAIIEYWLDKIKCLVICSRPKTTFSTTSVQLSLVIGLIGIAILAAINPGVCILSSSIYDKILGRNNLSSEWSLLFL